MVKKMVLCVVLLSLAVQFGFAEVDPNLIFELDATQPGNAFWKQWQPTIGAGPGILRGVGPNPRVPLLMSEEDGSENYIWYYHFDAAMETEGMSAGYAAGYAFESYGDMKLDPRKNYSFEAWIRRPGLVALSGGWAEHLIGNYNRNSGSGWGFQMYGVGTTHTFARSFARMRDNLGANRADQKIRSNSYNYATNPALWHHIVVTWDGTDPSGLTTGVTYFDGVNNFADYDGTLTPIPASYWESDDVDIFGGDEVRVGTAYNDALVTDQLWFRGDIALIRIYDYVLSAGDVQALYAEGVPVAAEPSPTVICTGDIPGDLNDDCQVDITDFAIIASNWLECNLDPETACFN